MAATYIPSAGVAATAFSISVVPSSSHIVPTTTRLPSSHTASTTPRGSSGVSHGTLAGAIVGSIAGTAALAFLAAWLFFRRYQKTRSSFKQYEGGGEYTSSAIVKAGRSDSPDQNTLPIAGPKATSTNDKLFWGKTEKNSWLASALLRYIPEPAGDESVVQRTLTLFDQASLHIDNYYSQALSISLLPDFGENSRISDFGTPYLPGSLTSLLKRSSIRRLIITHTLVYSLLLAIQPHSAAKESLLPIPFTIGPLKQTEQANNADQESSQALYIWRMITAYLSQLATPEATTTDLAVRDKAIHNFVETFTSSFAPYADSLHPQEDRIRHLRTVTTTAADLGRWLFGQPCTFDFAYTGPVRHGEFVVLPAIVKVLDEAGQRLANKVILCEAVTAKL